MQKTEKHCKNQCFCHHKTTKISPKTGPKTQKSASGPGHLRNRKKRCCKPKNWGQKVEKHGVFSLFACRFWTGAFTNRCLPYCFLQCFLKASVTTYQKQEVLAEKCPPPGKPVTFYECHPEDHAPAPSVRADFFEFKWFFNIFFVWEIGKKRRFLHSAFVKRLLKAFVYIYISYICVFFSKLWFAVSPSRIEKSPFWMEISPFKLF